MLGLARRRRFKFMDLFGWVKVIPPLFLDLLTPYSLYLLHLRFSPFPFLRFLNISSLTHSIHPINTPSKHHINKPTHTLNTPYQHTFSTHPQPTLSTHPINTPSPHRYRCPCAARATQIIARSATVGR